MHLVDGTYELFRAHYGAPPARTADGRVVGATRGLLRSLWSLLRQPEVSHVACAFDSVIESFRNDLFAGYKTGDGIDPDLRGQFELAEHAVRALGISVWSMVEFEADDALASAAARYAADPRVERVLLCSPDKDLAQCVTAKVVCLDRRRRTVLDTAGVAAKFGVRPESIPDWLALVGDSADGIPGIRRWGAKAAATVLSRYGTLAAIPADAHDWDVAVRGAAGLADSLARDRQAADLYRLLATLRTDVPLPTDVEALRWRGVDRSALAAVLADLDMDDFTAGARAAT